MSAKRGPLAPLAIVPQAAATTLTVASALRETVLRDAELVAGAAGLERRIDGVAVLDVADLDGVSLNQLVLVNAYALLETDVCRLVQRLSSREASGLGIKLDSYWPRMPDALVASADAAGLPLLALPSGRFDELVNPILSSIADGQASVLRSTADFHRALTEAALRDENPGSAAEILASALGREVAIFDEHAEVLTASDGLEPRWERLADLALAAAGEGQFESDEETYLVAPVSAKGRTYGAVCVRGADPSNAIARSAIVEAAVATGMQLLGRRHMEAVHRRFESEVLDDLVGGRLSAREARMRADRVGWPVRRPYLVMLVARRVTPDHTNNGIEAVMADEDLQTLTRALRGERFLARTFRYRGGLAIVVHCTRTDDPREVADAVAARLARVRAVTWARERLVVAASRATLDIVRLPSAVREAGIVLTMAPGLQNNESRVAHFADLGAAGLMANVSDKSRLVAIARAELAPLGDLDSTGARDLLETLSVLLAHNMHLSESARDLYFHYNTMRHRLARLRELFGERLETLDGQRSLWLALIAVRIAKFDSLAEGPLISG